MSQSLGRVALVGVSVLLLSTLAEAIPIAYNEPELSFGVPVTGQIATWNGYDWPIGAQYYLLQASDGDVVEVTGTRLVPGYDMAFWIYEGQFDDTAQFRRPGEFPALFDSGDPGYIGFYDDEIAPPGDPWARFVAPATGAYTIAVTNSGSPWHLGSISLCGGCGSSYPFELVARVPTDVPEPASFLLLALGLGLVLVGRRRES